MVPRGAALKSAPTGSGKAETAVGAQDRPDRMGECTSRTRHVRIGRHDLQTGRDRCNHHLRRERLRPSLCRISRRQKRRSSRFWIGGTVSTGAGGNRHLSFGRGRTRPVKPSPDTREPNRPNPEDEHAQNVGPEESEIDQILADSFPASDAPPWTLGVPSTGRTSVRKRKGHRG
jgi:hypothetical protein